MAKMIVMMNRMNQKIVENLNANLANFSAKITNVFILHKYVTVMMTVVTSAMNRIVMSMNALKTNLNVPQMAVQFLSVFRQRKNATKSQIVQEVRTKFTVQPGNVTSLSISVTMVPAYQKFGFVTRKMIVETIVMS